MMLITGAAGFIGSHACARYYQKNYLKNDDPIGVDNYSRGRSCDQLTGERIGGVQVGRISVEHMVAAPPFQGYPDAVIHLAAQVSVVRSIQHPVSDLRNNAFEALLLCQWAQAHGVKKFIYSSTNKVYGELRGRVDPILDWHSINPQTPYGISKAAAGMYVRDLLPDTGYDFRQSCICGPSQDVHASEDQGWVGWLIKSIRDGRPITCYGDGNQVRDLLYVDDLLDVYDYALEGKIPAGSYTVGGGPDNAFAFREVVEILGGRIDKYEPARPKDQKYFIAASDGLRRAGWKPKTNVRDWLDSVNP